MSGKNRGVLRSVEASFNIFDSGWKKFGNHRKYLSDNIDRLINGDIVQERVQRRVMVGFFGHKSNPRLEPVESPDNLPSNLTVRLKFYPASGDVEHEQEILDTKAGRAVLSLHDSRIGNFSWRGKSKGRVAPDQFSEDSSRHLRFDYVYAPGMVKQPKKDIFISESADEFEPVRRRFLENGLVLEEALEMTADWQRRGCLTYELESQCRESDLENHLLRKQLTEYRQADFERRGLIQEVAQSGPYVFSDELLDFLAGGTPKNKDDVLAYIEEIRAYHHIDSGQFPGFSALKEDELSFEDSSFFQSKPSGFSLENSALGIYTKKC